MIWLKLKKSPSCRFLYNLNAAGGEACDCSGFAFELGLGALQLILQAGFTHKSASTGGT